MKALRQILIEASILDIEGTLQAGDDRVELMNSMKKEFKALQKLKVADWEWVADEAQYCWFCPSFIKYALGVEADHIVFAVTTWEDDEGDRWTPEISMYVWREKDDIASNEFSIKALRDSSFYSSLKRLLSGVSKNINKTFADGMHDVLKSELEKRANVDAFRN